MEGPDYVLIITVHIEKVWRRPFDSKHAQMNSMHYGWLLG